MIHRQCSALAVASALLFTLVSPPSFAQKKFSDTASVVVVEVPVNVTVKGEAVTDLTAENFEVVDGRKELPIVGFEVIDLSTKNARARTSTGESVALPTAARRHFLLLFDLSFSDPTAVTRARDAAKEMVISGMNPSDLAAVAVYTASTGPRVVLNFTSDRTQLQLALDALGNPKFAKGADPLGLLVAPPGTSIQSASLASSGVRSETQQVNIETAAELNAMINRNDRSEMQSQVTLMTRRLADLAKLLESVNGRKFVVFLSEGFDDSLLVGAGGNARSGGGGGPEMGGGDIAEQSSQADSSSANIASGEIYRVSTDEMFGSGKVQNDLQRMAQSFKDANCVIQAIDIGGLRAGGSVRSETSGSNALTAIASETGGEVFNNFNDLKQALDVMIERTSVTYLLAVQPENLPADGKYHRLKVKLKNGPRGADLQHRPGFYAPTPLNQQRPEERRLRTVDKLFGREGGAIPLSIYAGPVRVAGGKPYVPVLIEADGRGLRTGVKGETLPIEVYTYALDAQGSVHDFFAQTLGINLKQVGAALDATGLKYYGHLDLDPGSYTVRVLVRNLETGSSSLEVLDVVVPDFAQPGPILSTPTVPEPLGKWVMVREAEERQRKVPFPYVLKDAPFMPTALPNFANGGETQVAVIAYNLAAGNLTARARLSGDGGAAAGGSEVTKVERFPGSSAGEEMVLVTVKHPALAAGLYRLELDLTDSAGKSAAATMPVRSLK